MKQYGLDVAVILFVAIVMAMLMVLVWLLQ